MDSFLYVDATAGGLLLQILVSGMAGVGIVAGTLWRRLTLRRTRRAQRAEHAEHAAADALTSNDGNDRAA